MPDQKKEGKKKKRNPVRDIFNSVLYLIKSNVQTVEYPLATMHFKAQSQLCVDGVAHRKGCVLSSSPFLLLSHCLCERKSSKLQCLWHGGRVLGAIISITRAA